MIGLSFSVNIFACGQNNARYDGSESAGIVRSHRSGCCAAQFALISAISLPMSPVCAFTFRRVMRWVGSRSRSERMAAMMVSKADLCVCWRRSMGEWRALRIWYILAILSDAIMWVTPSGSRGSVPCSKSAAPHRADNSALLMVLVAPCPTAWIVTCLAACMVGLGEGRLGGVLLGLNYVGMVLWHVHSGADNVHRASFC